jgi:hypothetical protein
MKSLLCRFNRLPSLILPLMLFCGVRPACATVTEVEAPRQNICVQLMGGGEPSKELGVELGPKDRRLVALSDLARVGPYQRVQSNELVFTQAETDPVALAAWRSKNPGLPDPAPHTLPQIWKPVMKANLPDSPNVLIVLSFNGDRITGYRVFDQSEKALPPGRMGILSLMSKPVALELGREQFTLGSREQRFVPVSTPTGKPASVRLSIAMEDQGEWRLVDRSSIVINPNRRRYALLAPGGATGVSLILLPPAPADPTL